MSGARNTRLIVTAPQDWFGEQQPGQNAERYAGGLQGVRFPATSILRTPKVDGYPVTSITAKRLASGLSYKR
jgi:hypothetical protein